MNKSKLLIAMAVASLVSSQVAVADAGGDNWSISGWINEALTYYDDGTGSDIVQNSDNGTTLGSRITLAGSTDITGGLTAGFEVILEPSDTANVLGLGSSGIDDNQNAHDIGVLGNSFNLSGGFGKVTVGLQSMPTDNIAVLEDPSLTLWASISPVFRGNGQTITGLGAGATNTTWGSFLQCLTVPGLGIGIDCNGIYRSGIRYDLPELFPGVSIAVAYANDDVYDANLKWKGEMAGLNAQLALGFATNQAGGTNAGGNEADMFAIQAGLMDTGTGIFGSIAYQIEDADNTAPTCAAGVTCGTGDDTDAYWLKVGIKRAFNSLGDTSLAFQYGSYNDQYGAGTTAAVAGTIQAGTNAISGGAALVANPGIVGSEVERIGFEVNQYFGSRFIMYGVWENLDLDVDCSSVACTTAYGGADELDTFTLGGVFFF